MKKFFKMHRMHRDEKGITGLETAIILIAFIVVASVFAYTVLSAGLFSSQKAEETIHSGIETGQSTVELNGGSVVAYKGTANGDECVTKLSFTLANALKNGEEIDLTPFYYIDSNGSLVSPMISDAETAWTAGASITAGLDAADYKEGKKSVKFTATAAIASGLLAYYNTPTTDLTAANQIALWVKSSTSQTAGNLQLLLCSDDAGATAIASGGTIDIPALAVNTWEQVFINLPDPSVLGSVESIGLSAAGAVADATVIHVDEVRTTVLSGNSSTSRNVTMIAYNDASVFLDDVAWTVEFVGGYEGSGSDYMLGSSEKAFITVWLQNYTVSGGVGTYSNGTGPGDPFVDSNDDHLGKNAEFYLQVMPPKGATLLIEKKTPAYLDPIMRLY